MDRRLWKRRWRKAVLAARILRNVPFVRMVGLNGSMATGDMHKGSDIDLFIVIERGHLYLGRFLATGAVRALRLEKRQGHVAGALCLNRYATTSYLDIADHNEYHARVFHNLTPLYSSGRTYEAYRIANAWMAGFGYPVQETRVVLGNVWFGFPLKLAAEVALAPLGFLERWCKAVQRRRMESLARSLEGSAVPVFTDVEVRLHAPK